MQSSICLVDVDEGGPTSTERDAQPPVSEPPPVTANFEPPAVPPGREFDDLDAYRAAKKQRKERRAAYSDQTSSKYR